jgi:branched-subunit amino acid ABC-type transport system permease component
MESVTGVALGAFVLALLENVVGAYTPIPTTFQDAISFTLLVVVLVLLPQGLPRLFARLSRRIDARG